MLLCLAYRPVTSLKSVSVDTHTNESPGNNPWKVVVVICCQIDIVKQQIVSGLQIEALFDLSVWHQQHMCSDDPK